MARLFEQILGMWTCGSRFDIAQKREGTDKNVCPTKQLWLEAGKVNP